MSSERRNLSQLLNIKEEDLDNVIIGLYNRLKRSGDTIDNLYSDDPHRVKAGDISKMDERQRELFYGIVKDCYEGLMTMPEIERIDDQFIIKIYDSDNNKYNEIKYSSLGLLENIIFTIYFYIYKFENASIEIKYLTNNSQKYVFAKLYTLILNIPNMPERLTALASDINSRGENIPVETYNADITIPSYRVVPPPPRDGWDNSTTTSKKGGVKRKTSKKKYRKRVRKNSRRKVKNNSRKRLKTRK